MKQKNLMKYFQLWKPEKPTLQNRRLKTLSDPNLEDPQRKLFLRAVKLMEEKKLYLDGYLSETDFCRRLCCSKNNLSSAINNYSGRNFRQFVNYYRVQYAVHLMENDPQLKLDDVGSMSGFNTQPSFNSAFKNHMLMRPSDYLRSMGIKPWSFSRRRTSKKKDKKQ